MTHAPLLSLSHFELNVSDLPAMEDFYTRVLGFVITDRGAGGGGLVFLSRNPGEHHQVVLNPGHGGEPAATRVDHLSFRVDSLDSLRRVHASLLENGVEVDTVSHGTTWSLYFRDPESNRLEVFVDTPWHVAQPLRFPIDLTMSDEALTAWTESKIKALPDFSSAQSWRTRHASRFED